MSEFPSPTKNYAQAVPGLIPGAFGVLNWAIQVDPWLTLQVPRVMVDVNDQWFLRATPSEPAATQWSWASPQFPSAKSPFVWRLDLKLNGRPFAIVNSASDLDGFAWIMAALEADALIVEPRSASGKFETDSEGLLMKLVPSRSDVKEAALEIGAWLKAQE